MDDINEKLNQLSTEERKIALEILKEYKESGKSDLFDSLKYADYDEIPVDIETFLKDSRYLGNAWHDAEGNFKMYPYWLNRLKELFPDNTTTKVNTFIASGARGLGKSEIAVAVMCYMLYRVMCLKNPMQHFHLKPTEKIVFALMNIKLELAEEIATSKFQNSIKESPWFMQRGSLSGRTTLVWQPDARYHIDIKIGSQADDLIGLPVYFCLDGDTEILTTGGTFPIKELVNKNIRVLSIDDTGQIVISNVCYVKPTKVTSEEYDIELVDGTHIKCTGEHRLLLSDGSYKQACDLTEHDELADFQPKSPFGYIYKFTNLATNKIYIGKREKSFFDPNYYGSGKQWKLDLLKYGKENIKREVLCFGCSRNELNELEKYYIKLYHSQDAATGYNIHKGGQGGNSLNDTPKWSEMHAGAKNGRYHKEVSAETRKKISEGNRGKKRTDAFKQNVSLKMRGRKKPPDFGRRVSAAQKGRVKSAEERMRISQGLRNSTKNKNVHHSEETKQKISKALMGRPGLRGPINPMYGKCHSAETLAKMRRNRTPKWGGDNPHAKSVQCVETKEIFRSLKEAREKHPECKRIGDCCRGRVPSTGNLSWRWYTDEN